MGFDYILLNFIPTVGSIVATIFPALIAFAQSDGYSLFLIVLSGVGLIQICIGNILEPRLTGSSFNLSPIVILLNLALWGYIWGHTWHVSLRPVLDYHYDYTESFSPDAPDCRNAFK